MYSLSERIAALGGPAKVRFFIPCRPLHDWGFVRLTRSDDAEVMQECVIDESRYKVADGYKITLRPLVEEYAYASFYQMDLNSLMRRLPDKFWMISKE